MTTILLVLLAAYLIFYASHPQHKAVRPCRFLLAYACVLVAGTFRSTDPEGRSFRVGPIDAAVYAWDVSK